MNSRRVQTFGSSGRLLMLFALLARGTLSLDFAARATSEVAVFYSGIGGFPCVRVPSLVAVPGVALLAFAECRHFVGDSCEPTDTHRWNSTDKQSRIICLRRSLDNGSSWGPLQVDVCAGWHAAYPTASYHAASDTVVLQFSAWPVDGPRNERAYLSPTVMQVTSTDYGMTWGSPHAVAGVARQFLGGCRSDATSTGRLLFTGYDHPATSRVMSASVWASDDAGVTYRTLVSGVSGGEPQLARLDLTGQRLALYLRGNTSAPPWVSNSFDGGRTWSAVAPSAVPAQGQLLTSIKVTFFCFCSVTTLF